MLTPKPDKDIKREITGPSRIILILNQFNTFFKCFEGQAWIFSLAGLGDSEHCWDWGDFISCCFTKPLASKFWCVFKQGSIKES